MSSLSAASSSTASSSLRRAPENRGPAAGRPVVRLKESLPRQLHLEMGHPWVYDDEIANISELGVHTAGTLVDVVDSLDQPMGVGVLNRQASIVVRRMEGLSAGTEVTQDVMRGRLRAAFAARESSHGNEAVCFTRVVHGEADGLPGIFVDRFGSSAVVTFESVGSARLEFLVQEELTRWMGRLDTLAVHRMSSKKEKWAQGGTEFTTSLVRGDSPRVLAVEPSCTFEIDVHQGVLGHWHYGLEALRQSLVRRVAHSGIVLDAWAHLGQWGTRCAKEGASEVVMLEDSLGFAKLCKDNVARNDVDLQCTVLHRSDVLEELENMATSGIRFNCVSLNLRMRIEFYWKQRRGQFGRWHKPTLKGYARAVRLAAQVTSRGGYLVVTFLLPLSAEHWAVSLVQDGLERASRVGSLVYHATALNDDAALASSTMDDVWSPVLVCVRLN